VSNFTNADYLAAVEKAKDYIRAGDIFQVVPSQRWAQDFPLPPFALYRSLRRTNPSPFMFYFNFGGFQVIGASPEILVRLRDGRGDDPPHRRHPPPRRDARGGPRAGGRPAGRREGAAPNI
jgi:anthranilate/para-aminobenzoate synthase component I